MLPKISNKSCSYETNNQRDGYTLDPKNSCHIKAKTILPHIRETQWIPNKNGKGSINYQYLVIKQRDKSQDSAVTQSTASHTSDMNKVQFKSNKTHLKSPVVLGRQNGEGKLDKLIRRIKPSFHRSLSSNPPEANASNTSLPNENTNDPGAMTQRLSSSASNPENDEKFSFSTADVGLNSETVSSKSCKDPKVKVDFTTEFFELPFSKERTRIPLKKIIPLKHLPVDPLAKIRKEKHVFSLGFKSVEKSESVQTLSDYQQNHLIALFRLCEAYTKNLGVDYLVALAKTSAIPQEVPLTEGDKPPEWHGGARIVEDPTERLWNWEKSLVNSSLLRDYQGRPVYNKDLDIRYMSQSPDDYQGSLGPNEYDAKSDIGALIIKDSDSSTDMEYDEMDFILANSTHPFADSVILAGGIHSSKAQNEYLKRAKNKEEIHSTAGTVSQIDSVNDQHLPDTMENKNLQVEHEEIFPAASPLPLGAEAGNTLLSPQKTPTDNTFTSVEPTSTTSTSFEKQKYTIAARTPSKHVKGEAQSQSKIEMKRRSRARFGRRKRGEKRQKDPIEIPIDFPVENIQCGFENYAVDWCKIITAASAPNPLYWFEAMEAMRSGDFDKVSDSSEEPVKDRAVHGLGKRFTSVAGGLDGLYTILKQTVEPDQPKAEVIMDCMVKNYKLQMPLAVGDPVSLRELYINTIVKNPMLYKMVLRRRDILPDDLQALVAKIIEDTESSDAMLAALYPSKTNSDLIVSAAKEMFAPGYLSGGPPCPTTKSDNGKRPKKKSINDSGKDSTNISTEDDGATSAFVVYGSEVNHEKAFYASLRNPAESILQEVAYHIPEFAFHTRPLFETKWIEIGYDSSYEIILPELGQLRNIRQRRLKMLKLGLALTEKEEREESTRVQELSKELVDRICRLLTCPNRNTSNGIWMGLLASVHGIMFWPPIGDVLVSKLDIWIPNLLLALRCNYATVREEACCLIAFLACSYPLFCRLQIACRNLLISNIVLAILDAMNHHPDSYACFHGTLAYILHSIPCNATIDCLQIWIPEIMEREDESSLAKDWPLFFYYVAKHWPSFAIKWNAIYDRQIVNLLERGLTRRISKHNARIALGYMIRRRGYLSNIFTVWRNYDNEKQKEKE